MEIGTLLLVLFLVGLPIGLMAVVFVITFAEMKGERDEDRY